MGRGDRPHLVGVDSVVVVSQRDSEATDVFPRHVRMARCGTSPRTLDASPMTSSNRPAARRPGSQWDSFAPDVLIAVGESASGDDVDVAPEESFESVLEMQEVE